MLINQSVNHVDDHCCCAHTRPLDTVCAVCCRCGLRVCVAGGTAKELFSVCHMFFSLVVPLNVRFFLWGLPRLLCSSYLCVALLTVAVVANYLFSFCCHVCVCSGFSVAVVSVRARRQPDVEGGGHEHHIAGAVLVQ